MQEENDKEKQKQPIDMTNDELLDYAIAPEVAEQLRRIANPPQECDDSESEEG